MRTKTAIKIFISDVIPLIIISLIGIFKLKFFIQYLGNDNLGIYQLFTQIMVYIALIDGGLTVAVLHSLYKPNAENNKDKMISIIVGAQRVFSLIGTAIFGIAILLSFFVPYIIKDLPFSHTYVITAFILFASSSVIDYFFIPYKVFLELKERKYIVNAIASTGQIVRNLIEVLMLILGFSLPALLIMHIFLMLFTNLVLIITCKNIYKDYAFKHAKPDFAFVKQLKHLIFHKVNGLIGSNVDVIILTIYLGLKAVAVYSVYNYFIKTISNILNKVNVSIVALIGNFLETNKESKYSLYSELNSLSFYIAIVVCIPLFLALNPFVNLWFKDDVTTSVLVAFAFVFSLFIFVIKTPAATFVSSMGLFKETRICALIDTTINLTLSIILIQIIGIPGVIFATAVSVFVADYLLKTTIVFKHAFAKSSFYFFVNNIKFFIVALIDGAIGYLIINMVTISSLATWFGVFILFTLVNSTVIYFIFKLLGEQKFMDRFIRLIRRPKNA